MNIAHLARHRGRFGSFTVVVANDVVIAAGWEEPDRLFDLVHPSRRPATVRERAELGVVTDALRAYDRGDVEATDDIDVEQVAGPFHEEVRRQLRAIPPGTTCSYAQLAAAAGRPSAARAAGTACARNAIALFVPCHRAVGSDGNLRGFAYGLDQKRALLAHEAHARASATVGS